MDCVQSVPDMPNATQRAQKVRVALSPSLALSLSRQPRAASPPPAAGSRNGRQKEKKTVFRCSRSVECGEGVHERVAEEEPREDDVAESDEGELRRAVVARGEEERDENLDRHIQARGHRDHDLKGARGRAGSVPTLEHDGG
eukprot:3567873-Rhodomonas_salina.2